MAGQKIAEGFVELKLRTAALEAAMRKAEGKFRGGTSRMQSVAKKLAGSLAIAFSGMALIRFGAVAISTAAEFEKSMSSVKAVSGATGKAFKDMTDLAKKMGATTVFTAKQSADAMQFLAMAGLNTTEIMAALPGTLELAAAGSLELSTAADLATNVLGGMSLEVEELGRVNDVMAFTASKANTSVGELAGALRIAGPIANSLGISIEQVAATLGGMANQGFKAENAGQAVKQMFSKLLKASSGASEEVDEFGNVTNKAQSALDAMGIKLLDTTGKMRPLNAVLIDMKKAAITARQAQDIFGDRVFAAALAAVSATEAIGDLEEGMLGVNNTLKGTAKQMAATKLDNFAGQMTLLKSAWDAFLQSLGEFVTKSPNIISLIKSYTDGFSGLALALTDARNAIAGVRDPVDKLGEDFERLTKDVKRYGDILDNAEEGSNKYNNALKNLAHANTKLNEVMEKQAELIKGGTAGKRKAEKEAKAKAKIAEQEAKAAALLAEKEAAAEKKKSRRLKAEKKDLEAAGKLLQAKFAQEDAIIQAAAERDAETSEEKQALVQKRLDEQLLMFADNEEAKTAAVIQAFHDVEAIEKEFADKDAERDKNRVKSFGEAFAGIEALTQTHGEFMEEQGAKLANALNDTLTSGFVDIFNGEMKNMADLFGSVADTMKQALIGALAEMAATWIIKHALMMATATTTASVQVAAAAAAGTANVAAASASAAAWTAAAAAMMVALAPVLIAIAAVAIVGKALGVFKFEKGGIAPGGFKAMQEGGVINKPTLGLVGEGSNSEAVVPLPDNRSIPVKFEGSGAGSSQPMTINLVMDGRIIGRALADLSQRRGMTVDPAAILERGNI